MDVKAQELDRVMEALSPVLAKELERVIQETREALEMDFQVRLQGAVREAEENALRAAELERQRSIAETQESTRRQVTEELNQQFSKTLEEATGKLQSEFSAERAQIHRRLQQPRTAGAHRQNTLADGLVRRCPLRREARIQRLDPRAPHGHKGG